MANCGEIQRKLLDLHLAFLDAAARREIESHIAACPACRPLSEAIQSDLASLAAWRDEPPPKEVVAAVMRAVTGTLPRPPRRRARRKTEGIDLSALLGDGSPESLERELAELETLLAANRGSGSANDVDISRIDLFGGRRPGAPGRLSADDREKLL
ncbi:MAG: anti-sigma factor family protein, partial [Planctomycetota bacterium]